MVIDNLEKRHLVERRRDSTDRRVVTVHLTDTGRSLIEELFPRHLQAILAEMNILTPLEQTQLGHLCRKLGLRLD